MRDLRVVATVAGLLLLGATAHVTIEATGGYGTPHAVLTMAIAAGVGIGALCVGAAWSTGRRGLALWLAFAMLAGEAFGLLSTAERLIVSREAAQAPLRLAEKDHAKAAERVQNAAAALASLPITSPRLEAAKAAKGVADAAAVRKSAERGCLENCRKLLQSQVDAAATEVEQARAELSRARTAAEQELTAARAALANAKAPASPTPLADRVGVPAWIIDLVTAALGSMAANGLGCGLLAYGAHHTRRPQADQSAPAADVALLPPAEIEPAVRNRKHAAHFAFERLRPSEGAAAGAYLSEIRREYRRWCDERGQPPLPAAQIGSALAELFESAGIVLADRDGRLVAVGIAIKDQPETRALPAPHVPASGRLQLVQSAA
jgi:hypothetical protein